MCDQHEHVEVRQRILAANDRQAEQLRRELAGDGTLMLNLISSPGSGKTSLLTAVLERLSGGLRLACLVGDVETELDANRLLETGVEARQILTAGACHLDAEQIDHQRRHLKTQPLDVLLVENVGNLVCPSTYDLGEDFKVGLLSVTEGDDKPFKYPALFSRAALTVITKVDLLEHVDFDMDRVIAQLRTLNPATEVLLTSTRNGQGVDQVCRWMEARLKEKRALETASPSMPSAGH